MPDEQFYADMARINAERAAKGGQKGTYAGKKGGVDRTSVPSKRRKRQTSVPSMPRKWSSCGKGTTARR